MSNKPTYEEMAEQLKNLNAELARLKSSEKFFQKLVQNSLDVIFTIDLQGNYVFRNAMAKQMTGYSVEELMRMNIRDVVAPEDKRYLFERLEKRIKGESLPQPFAFDIIHKEGHHVPVELTTSPIKHAADKLVGVQGVARDISKRKKAERERERLIQKLQEALAEVKTLSGLLPICSHCKKIRDDKGSWIQIESFIHERSMAKFSHGICPECKKIHYSVKEPK